MSMKKNIAILILLSLYGVTNLSAQIDSGKKAIEEWNNSSLLVLVIQDN